MLQNFKAISLSYKKAPLDIRELIALDENSCRQFLQALKDFIQATDILVLSTCNRTEVYYNADTDFSQEIVKLLGITKGISNISSYFDYFTILNEHNDAVQHLFDVSMGLESQVVGDMQISNQAKQAYQWSADNDTAGPFLHRLMHTIFFTNKRVVQETSFRDGAASTSYAAVELIEELTADIADPKILVVGLGEIGADVCRNLKDSSFTDVRITNRTLTKAQHLAEECNMQVLPFEDIVQGLKEADVIISSVARETPFFTKEMIKRLDILSFKFFIDLSVPRSVETDVETIPGVLLYNIDTIQNKASEALQQRINSIPKVKAIITESIEQFNDWSKEMVVSPTINKLKNALENIRQEEIARYVKKLNPDEVKHIDNITKSMMQKIIKLPVLQLKAACKRGEAETLIDLLNDLFNLENQSEEIQL
ncbi:glutamyl-tRNA reductase [Pontibacter sp. BT310]|uniref:Glutamyl-tRNA reductase n=1 Tax=Pontibacter populi TaxID=890055 RepID=A0ABS6X8R1_9BACT|nr:MULTISPECIES: glutamyl-tRNA reductase [Pontibacter]MBJ6117522.1 glutamyl-tRNA reductase [Pontibacter sp. BT310]MBR0569947.1 glutamyl-tRNA reductase [Microvirga sp. STS03]MBW3364375.1 glutamyl-tRNA reductase [Pontibacter populi]